MNVPDDTRDRLIALEADVRAMRKEHAETSTKVDEVYRIMLQAKGARWAILAMAGLGGFIAAKLAILFPFFTPK